MIFVCVVEDFGDLLGVGGEGFDWVAGAYVFGAGDGG